ncbi:MAG: hypothetical protein ACRDRH_11105 [Pseudonocardia sp.]
MVQDATTDRRVGRRQAASARTSGAFNGVAFAVFAIAFALGALIHEFNSTFAWWIAVPVTVAALAVLMRPTSPVRLVVLLGLFVVECVSRLPNPVNHQILVGVLGATLGLWWLGLRWRAPRVATDPALLYERVAPYLRVAFILMWALAALAKVNTGFTDVVTTCSVWILESIPAVQVPQALAPAVIAGTIALELAVPALLLFHRTRPLAVVLAFGFHVVSAFAGHSWFSGFAWAFYFLFLPPAMLARGVVMARRALPERVRGGLVVAVRRAPVTLAVASVAWLGVRYGLLPKLPGSLADARHWGAVLICVVWMGLSGAILFRLRRHWIPAPARGPRASLRVRSPIMWVGIGLLVLNAAMPYLGVKTRAAFTMFSNIRTEPGHWNHLIVPESMRVFGWLDGGDVRFLDTDDPRLAEKIAGADSEHVVLLGARQLVDGFPDAMVRYTLDGVERVAGPVSADPVLGRPVSMPQEWFGAIRPYAEDGTCQH